MTIHVGLVMSRLGVCGGEPPQKTFAHCCPHYPNSRLKFCVHPSSLTTTSFECSGDVCRRWSSGGQGVL